jgi:hypothetical protein
VQKSLRDVGRRGLELASETVVGALLKVLHDLRQLVVRLRIGGWERCGFEAFVTTLRRP